jgi:hypothetical protein
MQFIGLSTDSLIHRLHRIYGSKVSKAFVLNVCVYVSVLSFALANQINNKSRDGRTGGATTPKHSYHAKNRAMTSHDSVIVPLQGTIGNQAVQRPIDSNEGFDFSKIAIQQKLKISQPDDEYEQEAGRVAEQVMRMSEPDAAAIITTIPLAGNESRSTQSIPNSSSFSSKTTANNNNSDFSLGVEVGHGNKSLSSRNSADLDTISRPTSESYTIYNFSTMPVLPRPSVSVQPKIGINPPGDIFEQEADHVSERIAYSTRAESSQPFKLDQLGRYRTGEDNRGGDGHLQTKRFRTPVNEERSTPPIVQEALQSSGQSLSESTRDYMEKWFGYDFRNVRVHTDKAAADAADAIEAHAFTAGSDIYFAPNFYDTSSLAGQKLLSHELTHVIQQQDTSRSNSATGSNLVQRKPRKGKRSDVTRTDFKTAAKVMYSIIQIINLQERTEPERWKESERWFATYKSLLNEWYVLTFGEKTKGGRTRLKGKALSDRLDAALAATRPIIDVLEAQGGGTWKKLLNSYVYPKIVEFEFESIENQTSPGSTVGEIQFGGFDVNPRPVSLEEFFSVVVKQDSRTDEIVRSTTGGKGYSLGVAKAGDLFKASNEEERLLLWLNGYGGLFYMSNGQIFAQHIGGFSEDVILGAVIVGYQNAVGSVILGNLMMDIAMSLTPWGVVWDAVMALEAASRGDWKEAGIRLLPGPAIGLASKTGAFRIGTRVLAKGASIAKGVAIGAVRWIGRGAYWLKGKLLRGFWVIGEEGSSAVGKRSYQFFDEGSNAWHPVSETEAWDYVRCNTCGFTAKGKGAAVSGATKEVLQDIRENIRLSPVYSSKGKILVNETRIKEVIEAYGAWGDHVVESILEACSKAKGAGKAVELANDFLEIAKKLSHIRGTISVIEDLASSSVHTVRGAMFELSWAAKHADEIEEIALPAAGKGWRGKGLDMLKKGGEAIELKNFDFTSQYYRENIGLSVQRIVKQVESRMGKKGVTSVTVVFSSHAGRIPEQFAKELTDALIELARRRHKAQSSLRWIRWP